MLVQFHGFFKGAKSRFFQPKISLDIEIPEDVKEAMASNADNKRTEQTADPDTELDWSLGSNENAVDRLLDFDYDLTQEALPPPVSLLNSSRFQNTVFLLMPWWLDNGIYRVHSKL